jgi:hypothetical protein
MTPAAPDRQSQFTTAFLPHCGEAAGQILAEQDAGFPGWYLRKTVLPRVEMCCCYFGRTGKAFLRSFVCQRGIISGPYITHSIYQYVFITNLVFATPSALHE